MRQLSELLESTADGAFAVDQDLEIVYWNQAAQEILGIDRDHAVGRLCYHVLQGIDERNRPFCRAFCRIAEAVSKREPVTSYDVQALTSRGERQWLNMSVFACWQCAEKGDTLIIHLFRDNTHNRDFEALFNRVLEVAQNGNDSQAKAPMANGSRAVFKDLTAREREVLALLAEGYGTRDLARRLVISPNTVRNHIQHILQKLNVHRRTEAVAIAIRNGFIR